MLFRVAILQYPIAWADKDSNLAHAERRIRRLKGKAELALMPEMFTTGFCTDRPDLAEDSDGRTIQRLKRLSHETGIAIVSSFICREETETHLNGQSQIQTQLYNRGFFIRPDGEVTFIDKAHLYAHGGEDRFFAAGRDRTIVEYLGVRLRLIICYDLRFPLWSRLDKNDRYDILLVVANWPEIRIQYWDALIAARATENQCYIAAANPVGDDGLGLHYNGHSIAYDTHLSPLVHFRNNEAATRIASFDIDRLHHFREVLPLWQDADEFNLING